MHKLCAKNCEQSGKWNGAGTKDGAWAGTKDFWWNTFNTVVVVLAIFGPLLQFVVFSACCMIYETMPVVC